jgi:hypothetical protein
MLKENYYIYYIHNTRNIFLRLEQRLPFPDWSGFQEDYSDPLGCQWSSK